MTTIVSFQKYNRAHDRMGRFTTSGSGQAVQGGGAGSVQTENSIADGTFMHNGVLHRVNTTVDFGDGEVSSHVMASDSSYTREQYFARIETEMQILGLSPEAIQYTKTAVEAGEKQPWEQNEPTNNWTTPLGEAIVAYTGAESRFMNRDLSLGKHLIHDLGTTYGARVLGGTAHGSTAISAPIKVGTVAERQAFVDDVTARSKANGDSDSRTRMETERAEVFARRVNALDMAIAGAPPLNHGNPVTVYRGSNNGQGQLAAYKNAMANGESVTFRNFSSTSIDKQYAIGATKGNAREPILLKITTTKGLVLGTTSNAKAEKEVLLPRNMSVEIVSITTKVFNTVTRTVVEMREVASPRPIDATIGKEIPLNKSFKYNRNHDRLGRFSSGGGGSGQAVQAGSGGQVRQENALDKLLEPTDDELEKEYAAMDAPKIPTAEEDYATLSEIIGWSGGKVTSNLVELTDEQLGAVLRAEDANNNMAAFTAAGVSDVAMGYIENKLYQGSQRDLHELAIEDYTSTAFAEINQILSTGRSVATMPKDVRDTVRQLDKAIRGAPPLAKNGESVTLYRGIRGTRKQMEFMAKALDTGKTISFKNFSSTSVIKQVGVFSSQQYAITEVTRNGPAKPFVMEIKAKKGLVIGKHSSMHEEAEVLLARGTTVRVTGIRVEKTPLMQRKEVIIVEVEVVD